MSCVVEIMKEEGFAQIAPKKKEDGRAVCATKQQPSAVGFFL